jgi:hypothetical protein
MSLSDENLASFERNFGSIDLPDDQIEECWPWEYGRESPKLIDLVSRWRAQVLTRTEVLTRDFSAYLGASGGVVTPFITVGNRTFLIELGAYYMIPEWPEKPYRKIPPASRREYLQTLQRAEERFLPPTGIEARPMEYGLRENSRWEKFLMSLRENTEANRFRAFRTDRSELVMMLIDWSLADKEILAQMSEWLKKNRPPTVSINTEHQGAGDPIRAKRKQLELLGKYRIVRANGGSWLNPDGERLFADQSHWIKCRKSVEEIIARFRPASYRTLLDRE